MSDLQCPARLIVARHGETEYESELVMDAGGSLTLRGREQARALGSSLGSERVAHVVTSSKSRAVQTGEIAAAALGVEVSVRENLHEIHVGGMLGQRFDATVAAPVLAAWRRGDLRDGLPGGGETGEETVARVLPVLASIADSFRGETVLVVCHGAVMLALLGRFAPDPAGTDEVGNCESFVLEGDADGWVLA